MTDELNHWSPYEGGATVGKPASESGIILEDDECAEARITLERGATIAPFAITCGLYGWFFHTRFFSTEDEARSEYKEMKIELGRMANLYSEPLASDEQINNILMAAASRFIDRFPT
jgi:hypothetical protein